MVKFSNNRQIYIYGESIDMRMGLPKIRILVGSNFTRAEIINSVFIFCSTDRKQIKVFFEDEYGVWLLQNRLYELKFKLPKDIKSGMKLTKHQLQMFLHGLDIIEQKPKLELEEKHYF